jgi:hypothetical protein
MKISSQGGDYDSKNENEIMMTLVVGSGGICGWREPGVRQSILSLYVWQESLFGRRKDVFTFNLLFK